METAEFARGLEQLLALARTNRTAVMCAEARVEDCHRRLLSDALVVAGARVLHLDEQRPPIEHALDPSVSVSGRRLVYSAGVQRGLFD
jgi:uncharacterized protein (DUF488 family)